MTLTNDPAGGHSGSFGFESTSSIDEAQDGLSNLPTIPELFLF